MSQFSFSKHKQLTPLTALLLSTISQGFINSANAAIAGFTSISLTEPPTSDLVIPNALNTNVDFDFDITETAILKSFTTEFGTVNTLAGVTSILNLITDNTIFEPGPGGNESPEVDSIRNYWGFESSEIDGVDSLLGLDVAHGIDNAETLDAFFGVTLAQNGASGVANDIFLTDLFGDDSIRILPLNKDGIPIGDFQLSINSGPGEAIFDTNDIGQWGDTNLDLSLFIDFTSENLFDDINLTGVAFDLSDFEGTGQLIGVAGIRIEGTSINSGAGSLDVGVIGYNSQAVQVVSVPEPRFSPLFGSILLLFCCGQMYYTRFQ